MYGCTVFQPNELKMNLAPVIEFTKSLAQYCTADQTAAALLKIHAKALESVSEATKTPEQLERNSRNLDRIKASLFQNRQHSAPAARPQSIYSVGGAL